MSPPLIACKTLVFCGLAAILLSTAAAQTSTPQGGETAVGGPLAGDQVFPSASVNAGGGYLVFQGPKSDGKGQGIGAFRLDSALTAIGAPFPVNQRPMGSQQHPSVALLNGGGAIVSWQTSVKGDSDVFARFLRPDGTFLTGDIQVNPALTTVKSNRTALLYGYKNNRLRNLRLRLSDSARLLRDRNSGAVTAALPDGGAVVAYSGWRRVHTNWMEIIQVVKTSRGRSYTNDLPQKFGAHQDWMKDVFFQRFDASGHKVGGEVLVNQFSKYQQRDPSIAVLPSGGFVIAWSSETFVQTYVPNSPTLRVKAGVQPVVAGVDVFARVFTAAGDAAGDEFKVNSAQRHCASPAVGALADGQFTVVWAQRDAARTNGWDIYARGFTSGGAASGEAFRVNTTTARDQHAPQIASVGANQLVTWTSFGQDGSREGVYAQALSGGVPAGDEFRVNSSTDGSQLHPAIAADGASRFLALWTSFNVESSFDLYSQTYGTVQPPSNPALAGVQFVDMHTRQAIAAGGGAPFPPLPPVPGLDVATVGNPRMTLTGPLEKLRLNWTAEVGARYQIQTSDNLKQWTNVGSPRSTTTGIDSIGIEAGGAAGFFRVIRVP